MLEVIGADAGGLAALPARALALVRAAALLLAPRRLLEEVEPWWQAEQAAGRIPAAQPCPQLLASDRPDQIFSPLEQALLCDPQTSGGLLVSCAPAAAGAVLEILRRHGCGQAAEIGQVEAAAGQPGLVVEIR